MTHVLLAAVVEPLILCMTYHCHIKAQTTPTHASGFHLFTVAMTGHAEEWGSTTATCNS